VQNKLEAVLENTALMTLRKMGVISEHEVAIKVGDIFVAEHVVTKNRRVLENCDVLQETRQLLHD